MASTSLSKRSPRSTSASRSKAQQLPKDLLTIADIPSVLDGKNIPDIVEVRGEAAVAEAAEWLDLPAAQVRVAVRSVAGHSAAGGSAR